MHPDRADGIVDLQLLIYEFDAVYENRSRYQADEESSISYRVTVSDTITGGSVSADKETADIGETVTLTVTPNGGYRLKAGTLKVNGGAEDNKDRRDQLHLHDAGNGRKG